MSQRILDEIEDQVIAMYEAPPFPSYSNKFRKASQEMYWKMRMLGMASDEYRNKKILDCGCGTGEYTCWYAAHDNEVTAIDLSLGSLECAQAYARSYNLDDRIHFKQKSVLELDYPDDSFDIVYSYGVLHHTPDPWRGFENMVRVCKSGGVVIVSVYSRYSRFIHSLRQKLIHLLAGNDIQKRCEWGMRMFPFTARKLKLRAHDDSDAILYDQFSIPYESLHTAGEILGWLKKKKPIYMGAFGPLRIRDYIYAASLPEYKYFEVTFDDYVLSRVTSGLLKGLTYLCHHKPGEGKTFPAPGAFSRLAVQLGWFFLGLRFSCFSIAGRKPAYVRSGKV